MPRSLVLLLLLILPIPSLPATAVAQDSAASALIDPNFVVPDLGDRRSLLMGRYRALAEHLARMERQEEATGVDERLVELFLPARPGDFRSRYRRELAVAGGRDDLTIWRQIAEAYLEGRRLADAATAAYQSFLKAKEPRDQAAALTIMAEAALAENRVRDAINLYNRAVMLYGAGDTRQRLAVLLETYEIRIKDIAVDAEASLPSACVVFNQPLKRPLPLPPGDYLRITPPPDADVTARANRICVKGLHHGQSYEVTVRAGLPGHGEAKLYRDFTRRFAVPDRNPRIAFSSGAYVLARHAGEALPVKTINLERLKLALYRVDDNNLVSMPVSQLFGQNIAPWGESQIAQSAGSEVWKGEFDLPEAPRNREVTSRIPLESLLAERRPGVYVLVARPPKADPRRSYDPQASQWLVVSDIGLSVIEGRDGLHVFSRSLASAEGLGAVELRLVARNNRLLGTATSDEGGLARFDPGLLRGKGGDAPAFVTARGSQGDYNFLRLAGPYLDLSERGVAGRAAPSGADAYLYSERGVYRPGETVKMSVLLRDTQTRALGGLPLTLAVSHPGGTEIYRKSATGDEFGGYLFEIPLSPSARAGTWRASAHLEDERRFVGAVTFQVEDFVPQRIAAELTSAVSALSADAVSEVTLAGRFLYGPPAADLKAEVALTLVKDSAPFPDYRDYSFGLVQEDFRPARQAVQRLRTDADGEARARLAIETLPDTSHPLKGRVVGTLFDVGGRPVYATLELPLRVRPVEVGIKSLTVGALGETQDARFEVIALDRNGETVPGRLLAVEWVRERYHYDWQYQGDRWQVRQSIEDEAIAAQDLTLDDDGRGLLERRLEGGRYRLDVYDRDGGSAASIRFSVGWWQAAKAPDTPDALELNLQEDALAAGGTLKAFVKAPFAGRAIIAVVSDRVHHLREVELPEAGLEVSLPVERDWGAGAYLLASAFRPQGGAPSRLPARAMNLAWFSIDRKDRVAEVAFELPPVVLPRQRLEVPLKLEGPGMAGQRLRLTLAAVDEGILRLTDFKSPDPGAYFLAQRRLGVQLRDLYGQLIEPLEGLAGRLRSGGDRAKAAENLQGLTRRSIKTVALYQRDIVTDEAGGARVTLELPDFTGRLRLMAVAYGAEMLGAGEADLVLRDPIVAELLPPRFLAPGDRAELAVSLHNTTETAQQVSLDITTEGPLSLVRGARLELELPAGTREERLISVEGLAPGEGALQLALSGPETDELIRRWDLAVRPAQPYVSERRVVFFAPGQSVTLGQEGLGAFLPGTAKTFVTVAAGPDFDRPLLTDWLARYPYGCSEQIISQALPMLYGAELTRAQGRTADERPLDHRIDRAILRLLDRQRGDGAIGLWYATGDAHAWLSAYSFDFLTRARERGHDVPRAAYDHLRQWLEGFVTRSDDNRLYAQAYALYTLARIGALPAGDLRYFAERQGSKIRTRLGLGHLAAALALAGEPDRAETWYAAALRKRRPRGSGIQDFGSDLRDGAALLALLAEGSDGGTRPLRLAETVEERFKAQRYFSTQESAWLVLASTALSARSSELRLGVDGEEVVARGAPYRRALEADELAVGLTIENRGSDTLRLVQGLRGVPREPLPAVEAGYSLRRTFHSGEGWVTDLSEVVQNDLVVVLLEGESLDRRQHDALVVDLLPAGFEIENAAIGSAAAGESYPFLPKLSAPLHAAARDDRYVAALRLSGRQKFALAYVLRAVTPGRFRLPGSFVEDMYLPERHARLASREVTIRRQP